MMADAANAAGVDFRVLAEAEGSSARAAASMVGDYTQLNVVAGFAETVDVITFDHEHVPLTILEELESRGVRVQPAASALAFAQNKLQMRKRLAMLDLPMPAWAEIQSASELDEFIGEQDGAVVLKTPIGGYDGKGVRIVRSSAEATDWLDNIDKFGGSLLAEEKVDFVRELAQLSARNSSGDFAAWPLVETRQVDGVCSVVIAPAPNSSAELLQHAHDVAKKIAEGLAAADKAKSELSAANQRVEVELAKSRTETASRLADAERRAQHLIDEAKTRATEEANKIVAAARVEAEQETVKAREHLREQVAALAVKGAEQILRKEVNASIHAELLSRLKSEL